MELDAARLARHLYLGTGSGFQADLFMFTPTLRRRFCHFRRIFFQTPNLARLYFAMKSWTSGADRVSSRLCPQPHRRLLSRTLCMAGGIEC